MPRYVFEVTIPPKAPYWLNPHEYAGVCHLSSEEEEWFTRFSGDVLPIDARHFADHLDSLKLQYTCQEPDLTRFQRVNLTDICLTESDPMRALSPNPITWLMGVRCFSDLSQVAFSDIVGRVRRERGLPMLRHLTEILRFMIEYDVQFTDVVPSEAFRTPIGQLELTTRALAPLVRTGFRWAELLLYVSAEDLLTIDQVGRGSLAQLEQTLASNDMYLLRG